MDPESSVRVLIEVALRALEVGARVVDCLALGFELGLQLLEARIVEARCAALRWAFAGCAPTRLAELAEFERGWPCVHLGGEVADLMLGCE